MRRLFQKSLLDRTKVRGRQGLSGDERVQMRWISIIGFVFFLLFAPLSAEPQKVPVNEFKGRITFARDGQVAVVDQSRYVLVTTDESTYTEGLVEKGAKATVIYRVGDNLALKIYTDREDLAAEEPKKK